MSQQPRAHRLEVDTSARKEKMISKTLSAQWLEGGNCDILPVVDACITWGTLRSGVGAISIP